MQKDEGGANDSLHEPAKKITHFNGLKKWNTEIVRVHTSLNEEFLNTFQACRKCIKLSFKRRQTLPGSLPLSSVLTCTLNLDNIVAMNPVLWLLMIYNAKPT